MNDSNFLRDNLKLLNEVNPSLYFQLIQTDPQSLQFIQTNKQEINIKREYEGQTYYYHAQSGAMEEARNWFEQLNLSNLSTIYIYGVGLGYYYEAAKEWLHQNEQRAVVFLEQDPNVLYRLLETEQGKSILNDTQVQLVYFNDLTEDKIILNELTWTYLIGHFVMCCLNLYREVNASGCLELEQLLSEQIAQKSMITDEYLQYGLPFFKNFYPNLLELPKSYFGNGLFDQFRHMPAIICGAGPSLNKQIELLKTLKDHAIIFAGGSALNALVAKGLTPHFGAGVDPNPEQYKRIEQTRNEKVPFFYRNRLFHQALDALLGPRLYLTGAGGYDIAAWFDEQLELNGDLLDEGHNIVNFCLEIAEALGCNPIILVGVDLAFTDNQIYAQGILEQTALDPSQSSTHFEDQPVLKTDINGKPIYTLWRWLLESDWTSKFTEAHSGLMIINATEGGVGFKNIPNVSLKETARNYLKEVYPLQSRIQEQIQAHSLASIEVNRVKQLMNDLQISLKHCSDQLVIILKEIDQAKQSGLNSYETPAAKLAEASLEKEIGYEYLLHTFDLIYSRVHLRDWQRLRDPRIQWNDKDKNLKELELQKQRFQFLKDVVQANKNIISTCLEIKQG